RGECRRGAGRAGMRGPRGRANERGRDGRRLEQAPCLLRAIAPSGNRDGVEQARRVLEGLYEQLKRGDELVSGDVEGAIRLAIAQGSLFDYDAATARPSFEEINLRKRAVRARTAAQDAYIRALRRHALVFGTGPAGTGKTWLAVAYAVQLFERKEVDRIILSRPAVEAG